MTCATSTAPAALARAVASQIIERLEYQQIKGKRADSLALELWLGATIAFRASGSPDTATHFETLAALLIATRGIAGLRQITALRETVRFFSSSGDAYDACQCDETIVSGDCLVIESERVIGLAWTWPIAVTSEHGNLHTVLNSAERVARDAGFTAEQIREALAQARKRGFEISRNWSL